MPTALLDINVLLSLAWPHHEFHAAARAWYDAWAPNGWATCPLTQLGFIRLSSNPHVIPHAVTPMDAVQMLQRYVALPQHLFWEDSLGCAHERLEWTRLQGHKQVTDAYLLALAASRGEKLATFDRAFIDLAGPARTGGLILLIPH